MDRSARGGALNRNVAGRGIFDFLRTKGEDKSITYAGEKFTQYFYGGEVQLRYPTRGGLQIREPRASQSRGQRRVEAMQVEIYADIICPWCYAGVRRFTRALAQFPGASSVEVRYRPYRLDAHAPPTAVRLLPLLEEQLDRRRQRLVRYTRAIVSEVARDEGIEIAWERILRVDTSSAHRLLALAWREYGSAVQRGLVERLFEAHFTRGANVADHRLLTTLAAAEGMDPGQARVYLASGDGADELRCDLEDAQRRVNGVPTFVFNGDLAMDGSQDLPTFLHTLEAVGAAGTGKADGLTRFSVAQGADLRSDRRTSPQAPRRRAPSTATAWPRVIL